MCQKEGALASATFLSPSGFGLHLCTTSVIIYITLLKMKMKMISVKETLHHYCEWKQYRFPQTEKICERNDILESWLGAGKARAHSRCGELVNEPWSRVDLLPDTSRMERNWNKQHQVSKGVGAIAFVTQSQAGTCSRPLEKH